MTAASGLAGQAGDAPRFRAPRWTRVYTFVGASLVLALSAATFFNSLQPAVVMTMGEAAAAAGLVLPMFQTAVAALALAVRLATLRVDVDGVGWGWGQAGFLMRRERIAALRLYKDAVAVAARRGFAWYLSARDYSPFPGLLAACRRSGIPLVEEARRAPLGARLQGYGAALDLLLLADILLSTFVFLQ